MSALRHLDYPPVWLLAFMALAWRLAEIWAPTGEALLWPGRVLIGLGLAVMVWAAWEMHRARTTIIPHRRPDALVSSGPFAWSRNPIYLADLAILAGWCLSLGAPHLAVLAWPLALVLEARFIRPEEGRLREGFGPAFEAYAGRVRRWI